MTNIQKLDFILTKISELKKFSYSQEIFRSVSTEIEGGELGIIVNKLVNDGFVEKKIDTSNTSNSINPAFYCRLTYDGIIFLENGGYFTQNKKENRNKIWLKTKILANRLNAIIVLTLAIIGIYLSWKASQTEKKNNMENNKPHIISKKSQQLEYVPSTNSVDLLRHFAIAKV
jgi:hypothetical protein